MILGSKNILSGHSENEWKQKIPFVTIRWQENLQFQFDRFFIYQWQSKAIRILVATNFIRSGNF